MDPQPSYLPNRALYSDAPMTVKELPLSMQPREEFEQRGAANVPDEILIAIILRSGTHGKNVAELARELLRHYKNLFELAKADYEELRSLKIKGLGKVKCMELAATLEIGHRIAQQPAQQTAANFREPESVYRLLSPLARALQQEIFWVLLLDTKNNLIGQPVETTRGLLDSSPVHPREVFSKAVRYSAASVILAHNHPSGDPTPSKEDIDITRRLVEAAQILGIRVLDHLIIGKPSSNHPSYLSLLEKNLVSFK